MQIDLDCNLRYGIGLARAALGAMIFALPLIMTMEMWEFGATVEPVRLMLTLGLSLPVLIGLSYYAGFEATFSLIDNVLDAFAAFFVSVATCAAVLLLIGELDPHMPLNIVVGKLAVVSFPASIGAMLADKQFNDRDEAQPRTSLSAGFLGRLFVMSIGALFLALNVAPTDEIELIATNINPFQAILLSLVSLAILVLTLRAIDSEMDGGATPLLRHAARGLAGYAVCLLLSLYVLWFFGRTDGNAFEEVLETVIVLAFPAALGAGAARLIFGRGGEE